MQKTCPARIKAAGTADGLNDGQFRALVSVFDTKDSMGDVVAPGAFADTLSQWAESGDRIPVYWSHQMQDPDYNIGWVEEAKETADGLEVLATLDLEEDASPKAKQVYRLLKGRRVTQFSFAYDVLDGGTVEKDGDEYYELRTLKLYELGPTPIGANANTELIGVKHAAHQIVAAAAEMKADRTLTEDDQSALTEALDALTTSVEQIKNVLDSSEPPEDAPPDDAPEDDTEEPKARTTQEKASTTGPATAKESPGVGTTAKEPSRGTPATTWAAHLNYLEQEVPLWD